MATAPATPEEARAEQQRRRAAVAVGGAAVVGGGAETAADIAAIPPAAARAAAAGTILAGLVAFLADQRGQSETFLRAELARRAPALAQPVVSPEGEGVSPIDAVIAQEDAFEQEFARRQTERFARDLTAALAIPDGAKREGAVRGLVQREEVYARQRAEAMAARAFAAVDRTVLKVQSPTGAFWKLDPTVIEHTAGCLLMGGKFWPWEVLDRVHPPRHHGCPCRLLSYGAAIADGLLAPGQVLDAATAVRRAAHVVMEGALIVPAADGEALIEAAGGRETMELYAALLRAGLAEQDVLDRVVG